MNESKPSTDKLTYESYLGIPELLALQEPMARPESHDEMLFIISHQVFELWFRLMLHELDRIAVMLDDDNVRETERLLRRLTSTVRLFIPKLSLLETMIPSDFIHFRDNLRPASGFQSRQFREVEFICGVRNPRYLAMFDGNPEARRRLEARLDEPSLWDRFVRLLERKGTERRRWEGSGEHDCPDLSRPRPPRVEDPVRGHDRIRRDVFSLARTPCTDGPADDWRKARNGPEAGRGRLRAWTVGHDWAWNTFRKHSTNASSRSCGRRGRECSRLESVFHEKRLPSETGEVRTQKGKAKACHAIARPAAIVSNRWADQRRRVGAC